MWKILKARIPFGFIIIVASVVLVYIWQIWDPAVENERLILRLLSSVAVLIFQLPALALFFATFFVLNEEGQIPEGSITHRLLIGFFGGKEKVPDSFKLCPTYWVLVILVVAFLVIAAVVVFFLTILIAVIVHTYNSIKSPHYDFLILDGVDATLGVGDVLLIFVAAAFLIGAVFYIVSFFRSKEMFIVRWIKAAYDRACLEIFVESSKKN